MQRCIKRFASGIVHKMRNVHFTKPSGINNAVENVQCTCIGPNASMVCSSISCVDSIFNLGEWGKFECRQTKRMANKKPYTVNHSLHTHNYLMLNYIEMKLPSRRTRQKKGDREEERTNWHSSSLADVEEQKTPIELYQLHLLVSLNGPKWMFI